MLTTALPRRFSAARAAASRGADVLRVVPTVLRVVPTVPMRLSRLVAIVAAVALTIVIYQSLASQAALASSAAWLTSASKSLGGNVVHAYVYGSAGSPEDGWFPEAAAAFENSPPPPEPVAIEQPKVAAAAEPPSWMTSRSNLVFNAKLLLLFPEY